MAKKKATPMPKRDRDQEREGRPTRREGEKKRSKKGLIIGLSIGGAVLAVALVGLAVLLVVLLGHRDSPNATEENFDRIKQGMSREEVEKILGGGESVSYNAVNDALHAKRSKNPTTGDGQTYRWRNKGDTILLIIAPSGGEPGKGVVLGWFVQEQKQGQPRSRMLGVGKPG